MLPVASLESPSIWFHSMAPENDQLSSYSTEEMLLSGLLKLSAQADFSFFATSMFPPETLSPKLSPAPGELSWLPTKNCGNCTLLRMKRVIRNLRFPSQNYSSQEFSGNRN